MREHTLRVVCVVHIKVARHAGALFALPVHGELFVDLGVGAGVIGGGSSQAGGAASRNEEEEETQVSAV